MKQRWVIAVVLVASLFIMSSVVFGGLYEYFLKIGDVKGESRDAKHKDEIDVLSWSWGETQAGTATARGGLTAGRVQFRDVSITAKMSKASPVLLEACAMGRHYPQAVLTARKAGKWQQEFYMMKFYDVVVTSYQLGGSATGKEDLIDQFTFNFGKVAIEYKPEKPDGTLDPGIFFKWDVRTNNKF